MITEESGGDGEGAVPACRLEPDEETAPVVRQIFREYLAGRGIYGIAEMLTAQGVLCPSARDAARNPHYGGVAWSKGAVRAILVNPRYAECESTPGHVPLIDPADFTQAQQLAGRRQAGTGDESGGARRYRFRGLLRCGSCYRLMQGTWNNGEPYYRCRYPGWYAEANDIRHPRNVYLRESRLLGPLNTWLRSMCSPPHLRQLASPTGSGLNDVRDRLNHLLEWVENPPDGPAERPDKPCDSLGLRLVYRSDGGEVHVRMPLGAGAPILQGVVTL